jgi:hypothetical protein
MPGSEPLLVAKLQRIQDEGFRRCRALSERMQQGIERNYPDQLELLYIGHDSLKPIIRPWVNKFYKTMTRTIFEILRLLQPEDFANGNKVNFYFLPGYHSHLINKRIFYQEESDGPSGKSYKSFGIGLYGGATGSLEEYHDCCHARWYHYATTPPRPQHDITQSPPQKDFLPPSPYHWFAYQQPRITADDTHNLVASLTFSTVKSIAEDENFPEHKILNLVEKNESSLEWGTKVADMLNNMPHRSYPMWKFPDRGDRKHASDPDYDEQYEEKLRQIRCQLISLWMHSVFKSEPPDWWDQLNDELRKQQLTSMSDAIAQALDDKVACDWGDKHSKRKGFRTWTTVNLHPLIAPPPTPLFGQRDHAVRLYEASATSRQTIGWATMFCSVPLGIPFISVVRQWIRTVYSMLRSTEVTVLLRNREPHVRAAQMARHLSHDSHKFMDETVNTVLRQISDSDAAKTAYRTHIIHTLRALTTFMYMICNAVPHPDKVKAERSKLLASLNMESSRLVSIIYKVAADVQFYRTGTRHGPNATIAIPAQPSHDGQKIPDTTYAYCILLIGEMVRNYCNHGPAGKEAKLSATVEDGQLDIVLEGQAENRPVGENFAILDNLLETLKLGKAKVEEKDDTYRWRVSVKLSGEESAL